ncbi:hypothetical protein LOTGIDRAFT_171336 [Lottia gigantea]|uniref:Sushi domain-containing protein n=1 Tax=Lottia gigantea TaxID=225164 RepID=V4BBW0_LOTGI|nr:hypothetical protein LOTGIDRAFT_171336 [Lottia gigantea]ESP03542.1 hypothetical protein LOTGIDRAFT_171336 [Lottia gigantea]
MSGTKSISCSTTSGWGSPPTCTPIDLKNTIYAQFAPDWLMYLLGVLMSLLVLSCIACTIYHCCCRAAGAAIYPEGGGAARSTSCCPCGRRGENSSTYESNIIHNSNSVRKKQDVVTKHTTTTMHGTEVNHVEEPNGVYTTHDGLILVPVKPYELHEYHKNVSTKKAFPVHGGAHSDTNGSTPRSEKDGSDRNLKTVVKPMPLWMPHAKPVRNNNTSTH